VVPLLVKLLSPGSVIDVGCGVGTWLATFRENGVQRVCGLDQDLGDLTLLQIPQDTFIPCDLTNPPEQLGEWDLAVSLEVAEHLPPEQAEPFVRFLTSLSQVVFFSAAIPLAGGFQHLNEQWQSYWVEVFESFGYLPINCVRPAFWNANHVLTPYIQNTMLFVSREFLEASPDLQEIRERYRHLPVDVVHPKQWNYVVARPRREKPGLSGLLKQIPKALYHAIARRIGLPIEAADTYEFSTPDQGRYPVWIKRNT
jgi:SAM-dependent methyltransferase